MELDSNNSGNHYPRKPEVTHELMEYTHDLLATVLEDEDLIKYLQFTEKEITIISASMCVLCWILGHKNQVFAEGMASLEEELRAMDNTKPH